ncbi:MAG: rod shape-determining protein MreC [Acetobacterales bacterium]
MRVPATFKLAIHRLSLVLLFGAAFGLMMIGKADTLLVERIRTGVVDAVSPVLGMLSRPAATADIVVQEIRALTHLRAENAQLREENERLLRWQTLARRLESENRALKELLLFVPPPEAAFISARVIADAGSAFARSVLINAGRRDGVTKGQAVMHGHGLVGRVAEAGHRSARVLLLTDPNSRIPVQLEQSRSRAILAGDNTDLPRLNFLPEGVEVQPGERVVTSGHAGAFPPGLPAGIVTSVTEAGVRMQPFVSTARLEFVRVLDYGLDGILGADITQELKATTPASATAASPPHPGSVPADRPAEGTQRAP